MKRIIVNNTKVYAGADFNSEEKGELIDGQTVEFGKTITADGREWIEVIRNNEVEGYISGDAKLINPEKCIYINQDWADAHEMPDLASQKIRYYKKYDEIFITEKISQGAKVWYKIYDINGKSGYIEAETSLLSPNITGVKYVVYPEPVDVYKSPDIDSNKVATFNSGHKINIVSLFKDGSDRMWFQITDSECGGYISAETRLERYDIYEARQEEFLKSININNNSPIKKLLSILHLGDS